MAKPRGPLARWLIRHISYPLEAAAVYAFYGLCRALPMDAASAFGGWLARQLGPLLAGHRTALGNLARAMPELSEAERRAIVRGMWDNIGRTMAEYAHLQRIVAERLEVVGAEHIESLRTDGKAGFCVSGHLANWELLILGSARLGLTLTSVYRAPNNPYVGRLLAHCRGPEAGALIPKGPDGARDLMKTLSKGEHVGMLIDQKLNDGIAVPFFGRPAMTAPAVGRLASRGKLPVVPVRIERLRGVHFRATVLPPLELPDTPDKTADTLAVMTTLNQLLEDWIRARPAQWMWMHRRWPESR